MVDVGATYRAHHGSSVYAAVMSRELNDGDRVVRVTDGFFVCTPFAPQWSGEAWILPREEVARFDEIDPAEVTAFAEVLGDLLGRVERALDHPSINVLVLSAPLVDEAAKGFRWHARIQPRLTTPGGFELASGVSITSMTPESVAEILRGG
jgi:UDPglucose--hexose-1-phosphate uridylyltransferase